MEVIYFEKLILNYYLATITVNKIKLLLAAAVIVFDIMFLYQHFVLYGDGSKAKLQENDSLFGSKYVQKGEEEA